METCRTNFAEQYKPGAQARVAALFMDGQLVINNCGLEVESNAKA
jgi:hypothetical protein